jgi:hypothetical protein
MRSEQPGRVGPAMARALLAVWGDVEPSIGNKWSAGASEVRLPESVGEGWFGDGRDAESVENSEAMSGSVNAGEACRDCR